MRTLIDRLDALLPQTQCGLCGFGGCRPYAAALADGAADIDRCPPGGDSGAAALAAALECAPKPYDRARGPSPPAQVAWIDEAVCIGCTKCIQACPVDAIVGAAKLMHTVIADECTGCTLCIAPCPVDCIHLAPRAGALFAAAVAGPAIGRRRFDARAGRADARRRRRAVDLEGPVGTGPGARKDDATISDVLAAAQARALARRRDGGGSGPA